MTEWSEQYHMAIRPQWGLGGRGRGMCPLLKESMKAKDILYMPNINFHANFRHAL